MSSNYTAVITLFGFCGGPIGQRNDKQGRGIPIVSHTHMVP